VHLVNIVKMQDNKRSPKRILSYIYIQIRFSYQYSQSWT